MLKKLSIFVLVLVLVGLANAASLFSTNPNRTKVAPTLTIMGPTDDSRAEDTIKYDGPNDNNGIGLTAGGTFYGAVRFTPVDPCSLKSAIFYLYGTVSAPGYVYIHGPGTATAPGPKLDSVPYTGAVGIWNRVNFTSNLFLPSGTDFWLNLRLTHVAGQYPFGVDAGPSVMPARSFVSTDGSTYSSLASLGLDYNWNLRAIVVYRRFNNDVGVDAILSPGGYHLPNTLMTPSARIKNYGTAAQTTFQVVCSIVGPGGVVRHTNTQTVASLAAGATTNVTFGSWTPTIAELETVKFRTLLVGDENTLNDRMTQTCNISNVYTQDFEATNGNYVADPLTGGWEWGVPTYASGPSAAHSGTKLWGTVLAGPYAASANWKLTSIQVTANQNNPVLHYWQWYNIETNWDGGNLKYSLNGTNWTLLIPTSPAYNGTASVDNAGIPGEQCYTGTTGTTWTEVICPIPVNSGTQFYVRWHFGSDPSVQYAGWYIDDVLGEGFGVQAPPQRDVGVDAIVAPGVTQRINQAVVPIALVRNYGAATMTTFQVVCSIVGAGSAVRYTNTQTVMSLAAGDTVRVNFASWTPTIIENVNVAMRTNLTNDSNPANDRKTRTTEISNYMLIEGFNDVTFPPPGWQAIIGSGTYNWQRSTAGTYPTCVPYEGAGMATYQSFSASSGMSARLISPAISVTGATPCSLKFWMTHDPGYSTSADLIDVQTSPNGTTWTTVATFNRYAAVFAWTEHPVYLGSFSSNFYIAFNAVSAYGDNMYMDYVRVSGPNGIEEEPGTRVHFTVLNAVRPNPVKGIAHISFNIAEPTPANLRIYDASGRLVKTLFNSTKLDNGVYNLTWNGTDDNNRAVSEGIYFYTLETNHNNFTKKLVLTR
jgi:hypothetical protein